MIARARKEASESCREQETVFFLSIPYDSRKYRIDNSRNRLPVAWNSAPAEECGSAERSANS